MLIVLDHTVNGNCQCGAVADQLQIIGIHRTGDQIRTIAVEHIQVYREYYEDFLENNESVTEYLERMH